MAFVFVISAVIVFIPINFTIAVVSAIVIVVITVVSVIVTVVVTVVSVIDTTVTVAAAVSTSTRAASAGILINNSICRKAISSNCNTVFALILIIQDFCTAVMYTDYRKSSFLTAVSIFQAIRYRNCNLKFFSCCRNGGFGVALDC